MISNMGDQIRRARIERGWSRFYLARRCKMLSMPIHENTVYRMERDAKSVSVATLYSACVALRLDLVIRQRKRKPTV
jgi:transcriptional regulator with XRE-family HTH domain